mmetsp:Transcript_15931/g.40637  ORF Transcript_15931/g.40637 Transcript_15931/m.40637 type:complete len:225 (-) Transcript_15931:69-743(-)
MRGESPSSEMRTRAAMSLTRMARKPAATGMANMLPQLAPRWHPSPYQSSRMGFSSPCRRQTPWTSKPSKPMPSRGTNSRTSTSSGRSSSRLPLRQPNLVFDGDTGSSSQWLLAIQPFIRRDRNISMNNLQLFIKQALIPSLHHPFRFVFLLETFFVSTFDLCIWNAGVTHREQLHCSPDQLKLPTRALHWWQCSLPSFWPWSSSPAVFTTIHLSGSKKSELHLC